MKKYQKYIGEAVIGETIAIPYITGSNRNSAVQYLIGDVCERLQIDGKWYLKITDFDRVLYLPVTQ